MIYFLGFILLLLIFTGIVFYYYKLISRFLSLFKNADRKKFIYKALAIIFALLTINNFILSFVFFMYFICISLCIDLLYFILSRITKNKIIKNVYNTLLIPFCLTVIILVYGFININNIVETKYTIYTDKNIEDFRILYISDSHYGDVFEKEDLDSVKTRFDEVNADIVILGGDIVDESTSKEDMEYIFSVLGDIKNNNGIYFVYGNHDRQLYSTNPTYSTKELHSAITSNDIYIIRDNYIELDNNVILFGREDYSLKRKSIEEYSFGINKDKYLIMADHQPVQYDENIKNGIDLIVSGHTHAGQIFPVEFFINVLKTADLSYGYKDVEGMDAVVSSGLVGWGFPIRTSRHSEYVVIDVKKR